MPRFIHTADWHLNALRNRFPSYLERMRQFFGELDTVVETTTPDFMIVAGDIFERTDTTNAERQLLSDWLGRTTVPILAISGNHDKRSSLMGDTCLSYLSALNLKRHLIYDSYPDILRGFGCNFILFPYQGWTNHEMHLMLEVLVEKARLKPGPVIVIMHEPLVGCQADDGLLITRRNQIKIEAADFEVDYWALGHMHKVQQLFDNCFYCGAPHQTKFGEHEEKGVLVVDTDKPTDPEFIILETMPLLQLDQVPTEWPNAFVKLRTNEIVPDLPANVEYESIVLNVNRQTTTKSVGILDGLEQPLQRAGLRPDLQPLATQLAEELLAKAR